MSAGSIRATRSVKTKQIGKPPKGTSTRNVIGKIGTANAKSAQKTARLGTPPKPKGVKVARKPSSIWSPPASAVR